jgi:hypothetical protein
MTQRKPTALEDIRDRVVLGLLVFTGSLIAIMTAIFVALVVLGDGGSAASEDVTNITPSPRPTATVARTPSPPPTDPPTPTPDTETPQTGGDQPSGPLPDEQGNIPENVNLTPEMQSLRDTLQAMITEYQGTVAGIDVGVAVTDLTTNETVSIGGNVVHKTGCVINLFGLLSAVDAFQSGAGSPSGLEYSIKKGIGGSYPPEVRSFLSRIFGDSNVGVQHARDMMAQWGLKIATYDHIPYYGLSDNPPPNIVTPLEMNSVLMRLYYGQLFNAEWTGYTVGVLRDSYAYVDYILPKYLPYTATVGHKIGYFWDYDGWVNNDVGLVTFTGSDGKEHWYAISYFSQFAPSEYAGYSFGARISLAVWNFMAPRYGVAAQPVVTYAPPPPSTPVPTPAPTQEPTPTPPATPIATTPPPTRTPSPTPAPTPTRSPSPAPTPTPTQAAATAKPSP